MPLDLSGIKQFVEDEIMDDECLVTRDAAGNTDNTWDPETGEYDGPDDDTIYEGKCYVSGAGQQPQEDPEGGFDVNEVWYYLNIPLDVDGVEVPSLKDGDKVTITSSLRNPHLLVGSWRVQVEQLGTHKIKQKVRMRRVVHKRLR
jgi:hypothetical protein